MKKPKDYKDYLIALGALTLGREKVLQDIEQMKANKCFEHKAYYSRLKADLNEMCSTFKPEQQNELLQELNKKVDQSTHLYR